MLARGQTSRFLVFTRGDTLLGAEDNGVGWGDPVLIATGIGFGGASLCADPLGWGWTCWPDSFQQSVLACYNRGAGWSQPETVETSGALGSPRIASDGLGNLHCVWFDHTGGGSGELRHARRLGRPGVEESSEPQVSCSRRVATILAGASGIERLASYVIFDAMGRRVLNLKSGVYFVRSALSAVSREPSAVSKVVISR